MSVAKNRLKKATMKQNKTWTKVEVDKNTGARVLVFSTLTNGLSVSPADMGDEDALRELQDN